MVQREDSREFIRAVPYNAWKNMVNMLPLLCNLSLRVRGRCAWKLIQFVMIDNRLSLKAFLTRLMSN